MHRIKKRAIALFFYGCVCRYKSHSSCSCPLGNLQLEDSLPKASFRWRSLPPCSRQYLLAGFAIASCFSEGLLLQAAKNAVVVARLSKINFFMMVWTKVGSLNKFSTIANRDCRSFMLLQRLSRENVETCYSIYILACQQIGYRNSLFRVLFSNQYRLSKLARITVVPCTEPINHSKIAWTFQRQKGMMPCPCTIIHALCAI